MARILLSAVLLICAMPVTLRAQDLAVDHVWIHAGKGAPEAEALAKAGLQTDSNSGIARHTGQGTASVFVRFKNIYLELIWVDDKEALQRVAPEMGSTLLRPSTSSPFGIGLRHLSPVLASLPFKSTSYWAEWMRPGVSIAVAQRRSETPSDPAVFVVPDYMRWDSRTASQPTLLRAAMHRLEVGDVTRIRIHGPGLPSGSEAVRALLANGLVDFVAAESHLLELEFDGRRQTVLDLRPTLPLILYY